MSDKPTKPEAPKLKVIPGGAAESCLVKGCKGGSKTFGFCTEHYEHFKFGLIKKTGEQVLDYEKKFEHYQAYVARQKPAARKVA